jgi:hypothetical protein
MPARIPIGQFIGGLIWCGLLFAAAAYLLWFTPFEVRRRIASGRLTDAEAGEKLRKLKKTGYWMFAAAILSLTTQLMQWLWT